jgi:FlaG/FlaF family flagellin (archaellin)
MSLKNFHLLFIAISVVLAAFVAAWAGQQYRTLNSVGYIMTAAGALASGVGLAVYGATFQKKMRGLL